MFNFNGLQTIAASIGLVALGVVLALLWQGQLDHAHIPALLLPLTMSAWVISLGRFLMALWLSFQPLLSVDDLTDEYPAFPVRLDAIMLNLNRMGFVRLGELEIEIPLESPRLLWVLLHQESPVFADVDESGQVNLRTVFADRSLIETGWPDGEARREPDLWLNVVPDDLQIALGVHMKSIMQFRRPDRAPVALRSMPLLLRWYDIEMVQFGPRRQRYPLLLNLGGSLWLGLVFAVLVAYITADLGDVAVSSQGWALMSFSLLGGTLMYGLYRVLLNYRRQSVF